MQVSWWISKRLSLKSSGTFSSYIILISIIAVSLSLTVMIISNSMINGFQYEIKRKLFDFWGHAKIIKYENNYSFRENPIRADFKNLQEIKNLPAIQSTQSYINKAGIIKTDNDIEGIVLKGVFAPSLPTFSSYISSGENIELGDSMSTDLLISEYTAKRLLLKVKDKVLIYFIEENQAPKVRRFYVKGIYSTGLAEYDQVFAIGDARLLADLNQWGDTLISGIQISYKNMEDMDVASQSINELLPQDMACKTMQESNPNIFDWLNLQTLNEWIILILMSIVSIVNVINMLFIIIWERTHMIGILKALGSYNRTLQQIFIIIAARIIGWGLLIGNIVGIGLAWVQKKYGIIRLPEESYYVKVAPVVFDWGMILLINLATIIITFFVLLIPVLVINKVNPIKTIRFS